MSKFFFVMKKLCDSYKYTYTHTRANTHTHHARRTHVYIYTHAQTFNQFSLKVELKCVYTSAID